MKRVALLTIAVFILSACGAGPATDNITEIQPLGTQDQNIPLATPALPNGIGGDGVAPTSTFFVFPPAPPPTPTETLLPPLELPSPVANAPALLAWDGVPTYPGDSKAGYFFRLRYDPDIWALTSDNYGFPAIAHRGIEYCLITPSASRGLPSNLRVDHDIRRVGAVQYEVNTAYTSDGVKQFVTYVGGDTNIYTSFEVDFQQDSDRCLQAAEVVFATLTSVSEVRATPATPAP